MGESGLELLEYGAVFTYVSRYHLHPHPQRPAMMLDCVAVENLEDLSRQLTLSGTSPKKAFHRFFVSLMNNLRRSFSHFKNGYKGL